MGGHGEDMSPMDIEQEQQSYLRIAAALRNYRATSTNTMMRQKRHFDALHPKYKELFGDHTPLFQQWALGIQENTKFLDSIVRASEFLFECYWPDSQPKALYERPTPLDMDKVISTLKLFVRDWGAEGAIERSLTYDPIYQCLERHWPDRAQRGDVNVLVPGSGLSRLAFEISLRGFACQGNEYSHHMLIGGHFVLNHLQGRDSTKIYPYIDQSINVFKRDDQMRAVSIPDMCPAEVVHQLHENGMEQGDFSMVAGDFLEVYNRPNEIGRWGSVVTCYFIDTAHNIFEYIETIHRVLQPGGVWVNIGPLLYHFSDAPDEYSVDLSYDELRRIIVSYGFTIDEERRVQSGYTVNKESMKWAVFNNIYFSARKTGEPTIPSKDVFAVQPPHLYHEGDQAHVQHDETPQQQQQQGGGYEGGGGKRGGKGGKRGGKK